MDKKFFKDFPNPEEIQLLKSENVLNPYFEDSIFNYALVQRLSHCHYCSKVDPKSEMCFCPKGCYLESIGFLSELMKQEDKDAVVACLGHISELAYKVLDDIVDLRVKEESVAQQAENAFQESQRLKEQQEQLQKDLADFKEKKSHLGRPSKFENRRLFYALLWFGADKKPSYRELAEKLGVSIGQVCSDLKLLGYTKGEKSVQ